MERFRAGLVSKAYRLHHSTLDSRLLKKKKKENHVEGGELRVGALAGFIIYGSG